jgi:hypothetical protein
VPSPCHLTSCTPTKSNLYFEISSPTALREPALYILLTFHVRKRVRKVKIREVKQGDTSEVKLSEVE